MDWTLEDNMVECLFFLRIVHGTYLSVPSHNNLCLSNPMRFPLHFYSINMEYNSIKTILNL